MDGNDLGKFNTCLAHKQKTRKINLGRWEEAGSQAMGFCSAGKEPACPKLPVLGSEVVLGVLKAKVLGSRHQSGQLWMEGGSSHPSAVVTGVEERPRGARAGAGRWGRHSRSPPHPLVQRP